MNRFSKWLMALGVSALASTTALNAAEPLFADKVLAKGKGVEVKQSELDDAIMSLRASMAAQGQVMSEADRSKLRTNLVERMALSRLIVGRATADEKSDAKKLAEKVVEDTKKRAPSEEAFKRRLDAVGMKYETFVKRAEEEMITRKVIEREVASKITISDEMIKSFYDEKDKEKVFEQPEMVKAAHILLLTVDTATRAELPEDKKKEKRAKADQLLAKVKAGEDFAALVREHSEDSRSKPNNGEYTFARGGMGVPQVEAVAFALLPGQVSDVVLSEFGYHIVKVIEKTPPKKLTLPEVSGRIKDALLAEEIQKRLPEYYRKVRDESELKFFFEDAK